MLFDLATLAANFITVDDCIVAFTDSKDACKTALNDQWTVSQSGLFVTGVPAINHDVLQRASVGQDFTDVNDYINTNYPQVLAEVFNKFFTIKKGLYDVKELLENNTAQLNTVYKLDKSSPVGRAIGYEIRPRKSQNIKLQILSLSAFADSNDIITLYLYRANKKAPLASKQITLTADDEVWADVTNWVANYLNGSSGSGQSLFLLAYEYDANNIQSGKNFSLGTKLYEGYPSINPKYVGIHPVEFINGAVRWNNTTQTYDLPDLTQISYVNFWNGINFRYTCTCDLTQLLIDNKLIFARAIQLAWAIKILRDGVYSSEFNDVTESKRSEWYKASLRYEAELQGYNDEKAAFIPGELNKLSLDLSGLDRVCLPCQKRYEPNIVHMSYD